MAWLGSTFSDGISSIKGQITKVTKDILTEDPLGTTSYEGRIKELEEICQSYSKEIEKYRNEAQNRSLELSEESCQNVCELETQLLEVTTEKNRLVRALEDLDADHQKEMQFLLTDRNNLKKSLERCKLQLRDSSGNNFEELNAAIQQLNLQNDILVEESKAKDSELSVSRNEIAKLKKEINRLNGLSEPCTIEEKTDSHTLEDVCLADVEHRDLESEIRSIKSILEEKECDLRDALLENKTLRDENLQLANEKRNFDENEAKWEVERNEMKSLLQQLENTKKELESLCYAEKNAVMELANKNAQLEEKLEIVCSEKSSVENQFSEFAVQMQNKNIDLVRQIKDFESGNVEEHCQYTTIIDELKKEKADLSNVNALMENEVKTSKENIFELNSTLKSKCENIENLHKLIESLKLENNRLIQTNAEEKNTKLKLENEMLVKKIEVLSEEMSFQKEKLKTFNLLKNDLCTLKNDNTLLKEKLNAQDRVIEALKADAINLQGKMESIVMENSQLKIKAMETTDGEVSENIDELKEEMRSLHSQINYLGGIIEAKSERALKLSEENNEMMVKLQQLEESCQGKISVASEWFETLNEEVTKMAGSFGLPTPQPLDVISCLRDVNVKLSELQEQQRERSSVFSNILGLEIGNLNSIVNRIRQSSSNELNQHSDFEIINQQSTGDVLNQSQTDDVKRLKQDMAKMTGIIGMIDKGLTSILQDKTNLEKEMAVIQSIAKKTEIELSSSIKNKSNVEEEKNQLLLLLQQKDKDIEKIMANETELENKLESMNNTLRNLKEELRNCEIFKSKYEEQSKYCLTLQSHISEIENLSAEQSKIIDELNKKIMDYDVIAADLQANKGEMDERKDSVHMTEGLKEKYEILERKYIELEKQQSVATENEKLVLEDHISRLIQENADLKLLVQSLRDNIVNMSSKAEASFENNIQQHRRSQSQVLLDASGGGMEALRVELHQEQNRNQALIIQNQALMEKEMSLEKQLSRLKEHLMEVTEHHDIETAESEKALSECREKLALAEEQLRSSSTVYKSANVRSTQQVEALQSQIRLMSIQRDELQTNLSIAEDQIQKLSAAQASLQMVLEQFQLDKEREQQAASLRHEHQMHLSGRHLTELETEINNLKDQLAEAKNGLKAAHRLGEQLNKKSQQIANLEEELQKSRQEMSDAVNKLSAVNESSSGKIDKFLVKNLILGYFGAGQGQTKAQALKILVSVLDLTEEEKTKVGVDGQSGWLSSFLHPSSGTPSGESLSQAFVRFLESESRPQPQLKLLPESSALSSSTPKRSSSVLSHLVLPTVTPTQVSDSQGSALQHVLKES